jgi:hypothetical protein
MSFVIRVYTPAYMLIGQSESNNAFLGWLNNPNKHTLDLLEVQGVSLNPDSVLSSFSQPLVTLPKNQIVAIDMVNPDAQAAVQVPPRAELVVLYTERFVIQAHMHPAGDMPISNLFNVMGGDFFAVTNAKLHPVVSTRKLPVDTAKVLVVNKSFVDFYHARTG